MIILFIYFVSSVLFCFVFNVQIFCFFELNSSSKLMPWDYQQLRSARTVRDLSELENYSF